MSGSEKPTKTQRDSTRSERASIEQTSTSLAAAGLEKLPESSPPLSDTEIQTAAALALSLMDQEAKVMNALRRRLLSRTMDASLTDQKSKKQKTWTEIEMEEEQRPLSEVEKETLKRLAKERKERQTSSGE